MTMTWSVGSSALRRRGYGNRQPTDFVLGETKPTAANTGLAVLGLTTADLTVINGDLLIDNAYLAGSGQLDRLWVKGHVVFTANSAATLSNSLIQGGSFTPGTPPYNAIIYARSTGTARTSVLSLTNCKVTCIQPDVNLDGCNGERLGTLTRCDISLGSDLIDYWYPSIPRMFGCYLHDYSFWANDSKHTNDSVHPGWSHNDGMQCSGPGGAATIEGNNIELYAAPGVGDVAVLQTWAPNRNYGGNLMIIPNSTTVQGMIIKNNWFKGGECHIQMPANTGNFNSDNSWVIYGNRFTTDPHGYGPYSGSYSHQIIRWVTTMGPLPPVVHDNVWDDDPLVPQAMRGTDIPGFTIAAGQYLSSYNSSTP